MLCILETFLYHSATVLSFFPLLFLTSLHPKIWGSIFTQPLQSPFSSEPLPLEVMSSNSPDRPPPPFSLVCGSGLQREEWRLLLLLQPQRPFLGNWLGLPAALSSTLWVSNDNLYFLAHLRPLGGCPR